MTAIAVICATHMRLLICHANDGYGRLTAIAVICTVDIAMMGTNVK